MASQEHLWRRVFEAENVSRVIAKLNENSEEWPTIGKKSAAVLVPLLTVEGEPSVLFTLRSRELSHHRNQVSFPGGVADSTDATPTHTALRETEEELGIPSHTVEVWGELPSFPGRDLSTTITPVLSRVRGVDTSRLIVNKAEVEEVFTLSLHHLADPTHQCYTEFRFGQRMTSYRSPVFRGGPHRVWGFTALILDMVMGRLAPRALKYSPILARTFSTLTRSQRY